MDAPYDIGDPCTWTTAQVERAQRYHLRQFEVMSEELSHRLGWALRATVISPPVEGAAPQVPPDARPS